MKRLFQIPFILGLSFAFVLFSIYCCCFREMVQAKPATPPCHQTADQPDQSHNSQECTCHKNTLANDVKPVVNLELAYVVHLVVDAFSPVLNPAIVSSFPVYFESPPGFNSGLPLYIQHSVLRV